MARDRATRRALAMVVGDRSAATAQRLWGTLPDGYRTGAIVFTDFLASYQVVIPASQHRAVGQESGGPPVSSGSVSPRQRCARCVRKTLSFSTRERNHLGALWYFVRLYNMCRK